MGTEQMDKNFERYLLVWLDASINSEENIAAQKEIRSSINYLQTFDQLDICEKYIREIYSDDRIVLIVSGHFGQQLIPSIHQLRQVFSIYIFCGNKEFHQQWSEGYKKIQGVHNRLDELVRQIQFSQSSRRENKEDELLAFLVFDSSTRSEQSTTGLDGRFLQSQLLISCLLKTKTTSDDRKEFITLCRKSYEGNVGYLKTIDTFEETYVPEDSLYWYTEETFLYRVLNKALRIGDINLLFLLRFFIRDMEEQLSKHLCKSVIHAYRGQLISIEELNVLKESKGNLISFNSFMSTSVSRQIPMMYVDPAPNNEKLERVLLYIEADPGQCGIKPFADVSYISKFTEEQEILIMLGSVFRLTDIFCDEEKLWHIKISLCSDNDCDLQRVFHHMRNQYGSMDAELLFFANVLIDMANFDDAEKYLQRLLKQMSLNHKDIHKCYQALGKICCEKGNYPLSHYYFNQALRTSHSQSGYIYNHIGEVYQNQGDHKQALVSYKMALSSFQKTVTGNDESLAWCYNNLGIIYEKQKNYPKARQYLLKALTIKEKILPPEHPCIGNTYNNIANIHYHLGEYDQALQRYEQSHKTFQKSLTPRHPSIARVLKNIGVAYEAKKEFENAKKNYEKALLIREFVLLPSHPDLYEIKQDIARVSLQIE